MLGPLHDHALTAYGIGFTDLVKRPTANAAGLAPSEFIAGAAELVTKLERYQPRLACFHGMTAYRPFHRALFAGSVEDDLKLGLQPQVVGRTQLLAVPNPSPANAHFTPADQIAWYDRVADWLGQKDG